MDSSDGESCSSFGRPNPFLIPLVIQNIFKDLSLRELSNCRGVCQLWKTYTLPEVRKRRLIKILSTHQMELYIQLMSGVKPEDFPDCNYQLGYIKDREPGYQPPPRVRSGREMRDLTHNIIRRRRGRVEGLPTHYIHAVREMNFPPDPDIEGAHITEESKLLAQFFTLFGAHVKSLELHKYCQYDSAEIPKILSLTPNLESFVFVTPSSYSDYSLTSEKPQLQLPQLKTLGIVIRNPPEVEGDDNNTKQFLQTLLALVPNVERLSLGPRSPNLSGEFELAVGEVELLFGLFGGLVENQMSVFKATILAPTTAPLIYLKHIHLNYSLNDSEVKGLTMKGFPLETVKFRFDVNVKGASVDGLLRSLRGTLVKARLDICASRPFSELATYVFMARCLKLQDLTLAGYKGSFIFLDNFPGLKSLECVKPRLEDDVFPQDLIHHSLQELKLRYEPIKTRSVTQRITSSFPNLRTFEFLQGNDDCMRAIYLGLPYLENLAIFSAGCTDDGICGVPKHIYKDIIKNKSLALSFVEPGRIRTDLSIGSLTNLTNLRLEGDKITDVAVILGIISCKNLKSLILKSNQITDESLFNIATSRNMKTLRALHVSRCSQITEIGRTFLSGVLPNIAKSWGELADSRYSGYCNGWDTRGETNYCEMVGSTTQINTRRGETKDFKWLSSGTEDREWVAEIHDSDFSDTDEDDPSSVESVDDGISLEEV